MVLVYQYDDLKVREWEALRLIIDKKELTFRIIPNTLSRVALRDTKYCNVSNLFVGPTVLAFGKSLLISDMFKVVKSTHKLLLVGGVFEGELMTPHTLKEMSQLPEKEVVLQQLLASIKGPHTQLSRLVQNGSSKLSQLLTQYIQEKYK